MSLDDIKRQAQESANRARAELNKAESTVDTQVNEAYEFLQSGGVNTQSITVNFENNSFHLTGTVETGEEMQILNDVVTNSGSSSPILNNVELEDFTAKNILMTVKTRGSNLNARAGAGTDNKIVGKFSNESQVNLVKKSQKDWYLVRNNEVEGYCHTNFLTV
jgi:uncharacterized protein YgiM (DUF1202 family)